MIVPLAACNRKSESVDADASKTLSTAENDESTLQTNMTTDDDSITTDAENNTSSSEKKSSESEVSSKKSSTTSQKATSKKTTENPSASKVTYIDGILIANKTYGLPSNYNPGVDSTAQSALNKMISAAKKDGVSLFVISDFRSYSSQERIYNNYVSRDGKAEADRYSARPGHSEHQTGLAFDLNSLSQSFEYSAEGKWLAANCYKYGFIIRYPKNKESVTGYMYEPWHVRYLGTDISTKVYNSGLCLEEYLGITSKY